MRVLVCGGRGYSNREQMAAVLDFFHNRNNFTVLIHGGARGADSLAGEWAKEKGLEVVVFPAQWEKYGKAAGPMRNQQMICEGKPDFVIAFPGGKGTKDMVERAWEADLTVLELTERPLPT